MHWLFTNGLTFPMESETAVKSVSASAILCEETYS